MAGCQINPETDSINDSQTQQTSSDNQSTAPTDSESDTNPVTYSVTIQNEAGTALEKIRVEIYTDSTKADILQFKTTDANGTISFDRKGSAGGMVAVLLDVPAGYQVAEHYELTGLSTTIILKTGAALNDAQLDGAKFSLGDAMPDFTFTASDGREVTLSNLLENYQAVILNFWYMGCVPCKMEFPHLQDAYEQFSDDIAVIAMNPMDSTNDEIEAFRQENGYTFLMGKCDSRWGDMMKITSYPVTVVIDRFGNISMIHNGSVDNVQIFLDIFGYFTAEDYQQSFIRSHSQLPTYEP